MAWLSALKLSHCLKSALNCAEGPGFQRQSRNDSSIFCLSPFTLRIIRMPKWMEHESSWINWTSPAEKVPSKDQGSLVKPQLPPPKQHSVPCRVISWHSQDGFFFGLCWSYSNAVCISFFHLLYTSNCSLNFSPLGFLMVFMRPMSLFRLVHHSSTRYAYIKITRLSMLPPFIIHHIFPSFAASGRASRRAATWREELVSEARTHGGSWKIPQKWNTMRSENSWNFMKCVSQSLKKVYLGNLVGLSFLSLPKA